MRIDAVLIGLALLAIVIGIVLQRITGSGIGAVTAPPLVILFGPIAGVQVVHVLAALCSLVLLVSCLRDVNWRRALILTATAVAATPLGALLGFSLPEAALQVTLGVVMLAALFCVEALARTRLMRSRLGIVTTGLLAGVANGAVGQAGPLMSAYGIASGWALANFVASMQFCWFVVNGVAVAVKGLPDVSPMFAAAMLGAFVIGYLASWPIARVVPRAVAMRCLVVVAFAGSVLVLAKGVAGVFGW